MMLLEDLLVLLGLQVVLLVGNYQGKKIRIIQPENMILLNDSHQRKRKRAMYKQLKRKKDLKVIILNYLIPKEDV